MKITRTIQYKELIKLFNAVNAVKAHLDNIKNLLDSPRLPRDDAHENFKATLEDTIKYAKSLQYFYHTSKTAFEKNRPARFTPEQLKEMVYLRDAGLQIERLSKHFKSTKFSSLVSISSALV
jgi:hypothetical protein